MAVLADTEMARIAVLQHLALLDTPPEREFDTIVRLAQTLLGTKIALVSLIDSDRQWCKAKIGTSIDQSPRELAFCSHVVASDDIMIVADTRLDSRFSSHPLVTDGPNVRFYAGVPIRADLPDDPSRRIVLGALCVIDDEPRTPDPASIATLVELAHLVEALIAARSVSASAVRLAEDRRDGLNRLERKNRQFRQAERMANIGSWRLTLADEHVEWSEQTYAIHGVPVSEEPPLDAALRFYPGEARALINGALSRTIATGEPFDLETDFTNAQGEYRRVRSMGELELEEGRPVALIGVFQDITSRFAMEETLRQAAHTDELTRITSRGRFNEIVDERVSAATMSGSRCALLLIDLDHFKAVNDRCGHLAGDDVLRVMAAKLQAAYLSNSLAARLGGDEFVLLVTDQALLADLPCLLGRLLSDLHHRVRSNGLSLAVSATIGACWLGTEASTRSELLRCADKALYAAKHRQRGSAMIFGQSDLIVPAPVAGLGLKLVKP